MGSPILNHDAVMECKMIFKVCFFFYKASAIVLFFTVLHHLISKHICLWWRSLGDRSLCVKQELQCSGVKHQLDLNRSHIWVGFFPSGLHLWATPPRGCHILPGRRPFVFPAMGYPCLSGQGWVLTRVSPMQGNLLREQRGRWHWGSN